jgi:hypothetical protein
MQTFPWQTRPLAGLGAVNMQQVNTRNGIFANEGYGGGVFNLNVGFGSYGGQTREGAPTGLGQTHIPWTCWDEPGFKDCHAQCWREGYEQCTNNVDPDAFLGGKEECIQVLTEQCAVRDCVPDYCEHAPAASTPYMPPVDPDFEGIPCLDETTIKYVQSVIGTYVDGIWGPNSQRKYDAHVDDTGQTYRDIAAGCVGDLPFAEAAPPTPGPVIPTCPAGTRYDPNAGECVAFELPKPKPQKMSMAWMAIGGLALAAIVGGAVYAAKGKKAAA